jgi:hypothetical protein
MERFLTILYFFRNVLNFFILPDSESESPGRLNLILMEPLG